MSEPQGLELTTADALNLGVEHHQAGRLDIARELYRRVVEIEPQNAHALFLLGTACHDAGDTDDALAFLRRAVALNAQVAQYHYNLANVAFSMGDFEAAISAYQQAIDLQSDYAKAHNNLGNALKESGRLHEALERYQHATRLDGGFSLAWRNLGAVHALLDEPESAEQCFRESLRLDAGNPQTLIDLAQCLRGQRIRGEAAKTLDEEVSLYRKVLALDAQRESVHAALAAVLLEQGWVDEAVEHGRIAVQQKPSEPQSLYLLAQALERQDRIEDALDFAQQALSIEPQNVRFHVLVAMLLRQLGRFAPALEHYQEVLRIEPGNARAYYGRAMFQDVAQNRKLIPELEGLLARAQNSDSESIQLLFALGRAYDDCERYHEAFDCWIKANALVCRVQNLGYRDDPEGFAKIEAFFDKAWFERCHSDTGGQRAGVTPVFIVGMPRSGTTLVEQILGSHPQIHAAGELNRMSLIAGNMQRYLGADSPYPDCLHGISHEQLHEAGAVYLDSLPAVGESVRLVCDKMPGNFTHLGLIACMLPEAKIIHCRRDPLDTCISCFSQHFAHGQKFSYNLHELGRHYRRYAHLMDHWREVLPRPMLEIDYADVVQQPRQMIQTLLDYCEVDWHADCEAFHQSERSVKTASSVQVRQPLYTRSLSRAQRYGAALDPLRAALADPD